MSEEIKKGSTGRGTEPGGDGQDCWWQLQQSVCSMR